MRWTNGKTVAASAIFAAYRRRNRQRAEADRQFNTAETAAGCMEETAAALQPEDLPDGLFHEDSEEGRQVTAIMAALAVAVRTAAQDLRQAAQCLRQAAHG